MSYAMVSSCSLSGVQALPVTVEVHKSGGLPGLSIVGLPESAVRESKDRVRAAIENVDLVYPQARIIVNLAPADLPKRGGRFDFPIALGILQATEQLPEDCLQELIVLGELGLDGELRPVEGVLPVASAFSETENSLCIPLKNAQEALRCASAKVCAFANLDDAVKALRKRSKQPLQILSPEDLETSYSGVAWASASRPLDMADVSGQQQARRALEIAAAGSHNLLMAGPPGTGKSMLASRLPTIQPPMTDVECMETASVVSISSGGFSADSWGVRPFRAPHHTASGVALVGGGSIPMPGEVSLAHNGVLFLDELPEFSRVVLDVLREPMETGSITVSRAARQAVFPSRFQLVGAMNPCPCGYFNDPHVECRCGVEQIIRYQSKVSGPFLDRVDLHLILQRELGL
ncbi:MAG: YifB family Mg chelatase-like AAA ATPase, partial [Granulosicoccus sp.]